MWNYYINLDISETRNELRKSICLHLVVAESDGEPSIVAIDDLYIVISWAGYIHRVWAAGNHLLHLVPARLMVDCICNIKFYNLFPRGL